MKKLLCVLCVLALMIPALSLAELDEEELEIEEFDLDAGVPAEEAVWDFPVALEDMNPEYIILANKHYLLDKNYVPKDLVKVPSKPADGGIKWAVKPKGGQLLRKECAETGMFGDRALDADCHADASGSLHSFGYRIRLLLRLLRCAQQE